MHSHTRGKPDHIDTSCIGQGVSFDQKLGRFSMHCPFRQLAPIEIESGIIPWGEVKDYWYETGPHEVVRRGVALLGTKSKRDEPEVHEEATADGPKTGAESPEHAVSETKPQAPGTFILLKREGEGNLWHCMMEIFSLYLTLDAFSMTRDLHQKIDPYFNLTQDKTSPEKYVFDAKVIVGALLGACVVFLFTGLAINAVGRAAGAVVFEVRRQFREIPGIMEGTGRPEYGRVVDLVTRDSLRELATPGILAIMSPIAVGFGLGVGPLAGFLVGAIVTGMLMAVFLANAGGAWDNAKKLVEDGHHGGKGSEAHAATVIGDTVGDPFKDTAGPAINPLLKVMNLVALLIAPAVVALTYGDGASAPVRALIAGLAVAIIVAAVYTTKRRGIAVDD
jgi:hypothetical protein